MAIAEISAHELQERLAAGGVALFDVREPHEYEDGHVPGAVLVPLSDLGGHLDAFQAATGDILVICRSGARSMRAAQQLAASGIVATNVAGGTLDWLDSGFDVVEGADPE